MAGLYFYVSQEKIKDIIDCGLKLSEWYDRESFLPGSYGNKKVLKTFLNPNDDVKRLKNPSYQCLRLDVDPNYCIVGDADLYGMGLNEPTLMEQYKSTLAPLYNYHFGVFRNPEVLVMTSVLPDRIKIIGKTMDFPILYENSADLYLHNIMLKHEEIYKDSGNRLLYAFFILLVSQGKATRFEDKEHHKAVFFYQDSKEYVVLQIP